MAEKETPQEKFKRLSLARLDATLNQMRLLANLSGYNYRGTREDKDFVISSLRAAVEELEYRYSGDKGSNDIFSIAKPASQTEDQSEKKVEPDV